MYELLVFFKSGNIRPLTLQRNELYGRPSANYHIFDRYDDWHLSACTIENSQFGDGPRNIVMSQDITYRTEVAEAGRAEHFSRDTLQ